MTRRWSEAMTIDIPSEYEGVLSDAVASGAFATPQDALRHALEWLSHEQHLRLNAQAQLDERTGVQKGMPREVGIEELARQQNAKPFDKNEPLPIGLWPADESVDDFIACIREQRSAVPKNGTRSL